jgi:hypothetical protein
LYRNYHQLERICHFREAGLMFKDIRSILLARGKPGVKLLDKHLRQTAATIVDLKNRQPVLAGMLNRIASGAVWLRSM